MESGQNGRKIEKTHQINTQYISNLTIVSPVKMESGQNGRKLEKKTQNIQQIRPSFPRSKWNTVKIEENLKIHMKSTHYAVFNKSDRHFPGQNGRKIEKTC